MVSVNLVEALALKFASPLYVAVIECIPAGKLDVV
jgi:hypothetical protein